MSTEAPSELLSAYERFLRSLTPEEARTLREHSFSFCGLNGQLLSRGRENLFDVVTDMRRYIVDTNSNWKAEAAKPANRNTAFILSKTITDEQDDLRGLLFGSKVDISNNNLFILSVFHSEPPGAAPTLLLDRLDAHYRGVFDEESLKAGSRPRQEKIQKADAKFLAYNAEVRSNIEHERKAILLLLGKLTNISELPPPEMLSQRRARFLEYIRQQAPSCSGDYIRAVGVARHCYALLLMEMRKMRSEFADPDYLHVFGDTRLIHNALFMQAGLLSSDKPLKRMAAYAGLECVSQVPQSAAQ